MTDTGESFLTEAEEHFRGKLDGSYRGVPTTARPVRESARLDQLLLADEERGRMPLTESKYIVPSNPNLVRWEREVRKFLRNLTPRKEHRVASVHVFEWATGIPLAEFIENGGKPQSDLRHINTILRGYFGKGYQTNIAGRKILNCYRVPQGFYIRTHRPRTNELYAEYLAKTLYP